MLSGERRFKQRSERADPKLVDAAAREIRWLDVDGTVRRRVASAVRKGTAVDDPRDAALAVGYAEASLEWLSQRGRMRPFHLLLAVLLVGQVLVTWRWSLAGLLYPVLGFGFLRLRTPALRRRLTDALEANARLAAEWRLPAVRIRMPGNAWLRPGSRRRRRLMIVLGAGLVIVVYVVIATSFLISPRG